MIDFSRLFSPQFVFSSFLPAMKTFHVFFYILFGLFLVLALLAYFKIRKNTKENNLPHEKLWRKIFDAAIYLGIIGYILLFFRQQKVYFLSMPFLMYLWLISVIVWIVLIIRWKKNRMKKMQQEIQDKIEKEKYL